MSGALPLAIVVDRADVRRCLGYRLPASPSARVERRLHDLWKEALSSIAPRGTYRVVDGPVAASAGMPEPTEHVALAACTIGRELEEEARRHTANGRLLDALLYDAIGSAAAEATAEALQSVVCKDARERGLFATKRVSPGYGRWSVSRQRELLAPLPIGELGMSLTEGMMMVPRKSVSFAVRLAAEHEPSQRQRRCELCGMVDCRYRDGTKER